MSGSILPFAAAIFSGLLAAAAALERKRSFAARCFVAGMLILALECVLNGLSADSLVREDVAWWQSLVFVAKSLQSGIWLSFSLTYSRGNYSEFLTKWRFILGAAYILPLGVAMSFQQDLIEVLIDPAAGHTWWIRFGTTAKALNVVFLIATVLILVNLESTFRSTVGAMRWRIKFVVLGLAVLFGSRVYAGSEALLC
jgi:hypothetical protein